VGQLKDEHALVVKAEAAEEAEAQKAKDAKQAANDAFWSRLEKSEDPNDNL